MFSKMNITEHTPQSQWFKIGLEGKVLTAPYTILLPPSGIVDGAYGLIKKCTDVSQPGWDT